MTFHIDTSISHDAVPNQEDIVHPDPLFPHVDKKKNGVFYTPDEATQILCNWAIRHPDERILEPSFGGCSFLASSQQRLEQLNCLNPLQNIFGCDIDAAAFDYLRALFGNVDHPNFLKADFLNLGLADFDGDTFDVVIGNPPYVSRHNMLPEQKISVATLRNGSGVIDFRSSLWVYFVRHSLSFLRKGGRLAWILPSSFLHADYAQPLKDALRKYFSRSLVLLLVERIFLEAGTEEQVVCVLCDNFCGEPTGTLELGTAQDLGTMSTLISEWQEGRWHGVDSSLRPNLGLIDSQNTSYSQLAVSDEARCFGDFARVQIGIVTGANRFFVIDHGCALSKEIPDTALTFTLARFSDVLGMSVTTDRTLEIMNENKRCLLVDTSRIDVVEGKLKSYLDEFPEEKKSQNKTFQKRTVWHSPNDGKIPDAFFPYMQSDGPSLLLNRAKATSTNTIHRVFFHAGVTEVTKQALAISILSTFSQLSAEIEGRSYGSGVLKHEPSEAVRIKVLLPNNLDGEVVATMFGNIDIMLRLGLIGQAQKAADCFVFMHHPPSKRDFYVAELSKSLQEARLRRQRTSPTVGEF